MESTSLLHPRAEDLKQIAASVFSAMLGLDLQEPVSPESWRAAARILTAAVQLSGEWQGAVLLQCPGHQACTFAARFLGMSPPPEVDDEVRDVMGELANMIAGNLKCTLQPGIRLSIPSVMEGPPVQHDSIVVCELGFDTESGPFQLTAVEHRN